MSAIDEVAIRLNTYAGAHGGQYPKTFTVPRKLLIELDAEIYALVKAKDPRVPYGFLCDAEGRTIFRNVGIEAEEE